MNISSNEKSEKTENIPLSDAIVKYLTTKLLFDELFNDLKKDLVKYAFEQSAIEAINEWWPKFSESVLISLKKSFASNRFKSENYRERHEDYNQRINIFNRKF